MADFKIGDRVRHIEDDAVGTILEWDAGKDWGEIRFDDDLGKTLQCDASVLRVVWRAPEEVAVKEVTDG